MTRRTTISRDALLDAAEQVIAEGGASRLTLDAVADRAGVSKGGLQYVFKSKDALIQAMITRFIEAGEADYAAERERLGRDPRRALEAYVRSNFGGGEISTVHTALMAAVASNPDLLAPVRGLFEQSLSELTTATGLPRARVMAVTLAADALVLLSVLRLDYLTQEDREALMQELIDLAQPSSVAPPT